MTDLLDRPRPATSTTPETRPRIVGGPSEPLVESPQVHAARPVTAIAGGAARTWVLRHRVSLPIVAALLALGAWVLGTGIERFPAVGDDEGTYVAEAWAFVTHGQLSHYTFWYDHPPLGWIQLGILTQLFGGIVSGGSAVATARSLMLIPALATVAGLFVLARRTGLSRVGAAAAVGLLVLSPLGLQSLREVYLDDVALPWLLAAFALAASPTRKLWAFAGAGLCFAVAALSKETMLLFLPALVLLIGLRVDRRTRSFCYAAFGSAFVLIATGYPLYAVLKGELLPGPGHVSLGQAMVWQLGGRQGTGSLLSSGSAAHRLVASWVQVDPWLLGLGLLAGLVCLAPRRLRWVGVALLVPALVALRGGYLPEPFVIGLLPFCALALAGGIDLAVRIALDGQRGQRRVGLLEEVRRDGGAGGIGRVAVYRRVDRRVTAGRLSVVLVPLLVLIAVAAPSWVRADAQAMSADLVRPGLAAERWIERHVPHRARLMIDDTMYVDLVQHGFAPRYGAVWFYKLSFTNNLDPAIVRHLPEGWREFDYVVSTPVIRSALAQNPGGYGQVTQALAHSRAVAAFGPADARIVVRRIVGARTGSGALAPVTVPSHPTRRRVRPHRRPAHSHRHVGRHHHRRRVR